MMRHNAVACTMIAGPWNVNRNDDPRCWFGWQNISSKCRRPRIRNTWRKKKMFCFIGLDTCSGCCFPRWICIRRRYGVPTMLWCLQHWACEHWCWLESLCDQVRKEREPVEPWPWGRGCRDTGCRFGCVQSNEDPMLSCGTRDQTQVSARPNTIDKNFTTTRGTKWVLFPGSMGYNWHV